MQRLFLIVLFAAAANAQQPGAGANLYSKAKEAALGDELAQQVEKASTPLDNPAAAKYIIEMGARLATQLPNAPFPYTFALVATEGSRIEEALGLPGGHIYIPLNVFLAAKDESELAGVLAHAMAHVADRDYTRAATRSATAQMPTIPLIFLGALPGFGGRPAAIPVAFIPFANSSEIQADGLAVKMASGAGYDPEGLLRFIVAQRPAAYTGANNLDARIAALREALQTPPPGSNDEFLRLQEQLRRN